jgi:hypothetical protein
VQTYPEAQAAGQTGREVVVVVGVVVRVAEGK